MIRGALRRNLHSRWFQMLRRCFNPNSPSFKNYGGRGIGVRLSWLTFDNFLIDMGAPPPGTTLDREDNNGNYSPENCRWASWKEQSINRRTNVYIEFNGERLLQEEVAKRLGLHTTTLMYRLRRGWSLERALSPVKKGHL